MRMFTSGHVWALEKHSSDSLSELEEGPTYGLKAIKPQGGIQVIRRHRWQDTASVSLVTSLAAPCLPGQDNT